MRNGYLFPRALPCLFALEPGPRVKAQASSVYGSLRAPNRTSSGAAVPNATVAVRLLNGRCSRQKLTRLTGHVHFPASVPGDFAVRVERLNAGCRETSVTVLLGHEAAVNTVLQLEGHRQQVTVCSEMIESLRKEH
jgi:hypothetical protein